MLLAAVLLGLAIGLALGMLGGGGSVLAVPVLVYILGEGVHPATTASLVVVAAAALAGGIGPMRAGQSCWRHAAAFAGPATVGILPGTAANAAVGGGLIIALLAPLMLAAAWVTWRKASEAVDRGDSDRTGCPPVRMGPDALAGVAVGLLIGFFGVGGGLLVVPTLAIALRFSMHRAIATSLLIVGVASVIGLAAHLGTGNTLDVPITAAMTAGCVAGAVGGTQIAPRYSPRVLGRGFAMLLGAVAVYILVVTTFLGAVPAG